MSIMYKVLDPKPYTLSSSSDWTLFLVGFRVRAALGSP